jgi:sodium/proline symporter
VHGFDALYSSISALNPELNNAFTSVSGESLGILGIVSLLGWGLGYFGQPHILIRFMAIQSPHKIPAARRIALSWTCLGLVSALIIGYAGISILGDQLLDSDSEKVFIELLHLLLHPLPAGICLAAILAAIMSTADSQLLVASSALTEDIYKLFNKETNNEIHLVTIGRVAVIIITICAIVLALQADNNVLDLVAYAWAGFGATFGPIILLSLYMESMLKSSAIIGMMTGGITVIIWKNIDSGHWLFDLYELVPGFLIALLCIVLNQFLRQAKSQH